jgi:metal-responsive CopG/Arc/MetJ family transcriptional regulator
MPRTIVDIPNEQLHEVDRLCKALGLSRAEAVRQGLQSFVENNQDVQEEGFGLWRGAKVSRAELLKAIRSHW